MTVEFETSIDIKRFKGIIESALKGKCCKRKVLMSVCEIKTDSRWKRNSAGRMETVDSVSRMDLHKLPKSMQRIAQSLIVK